MSHRMSRSSQTKAFLNLIWYKSLLRSALNYDQSHIWLCNLLLLKSGSEIFINQLTLIAMSSRLVMQVLTGAQ
jgi:hypothetical protein